MTLTLFGYLFISGYSTVSEAAETNKNVQQVDAAAYLQDEGYEYGYATFSQANLINAFSNGEIEVAPFLLREEGKTIAHGWLVPKRYYSPEYHSGKTFVLLTHDEDAQLTFPEGERIYENESYVIYGFEDNAVYSTLMN
ncbi:MAG: hypothetical protein ACOYJB_10905 [Christensenellaceae bacterium]